VERQRWNYYSKNRSPKAITAPVTASRQSELEPSALSIRHAIG
jgi:hypothetical protein